MSGRNRKNLNIVDAARLAYQIKSTFVRPKTAQDYKNYVDRFERYLIAHEMHQLPIQEFDRQDAILYLDKLLLKGINAQTRNNYMMVMKALFNVLLEREYIAMNPFVNIKKIQETRKRRRVFTEQEQQIIMKYVGQTDKYLQLAICLCYYCAIRPVELRRLRVRNINLEVGVIFMDGTQTKNKDNASITIPSILIPLLKEYELHKYPANYYLFGAKTLRAGAKPCGRDTISKRHKKVVQTLKQTGFIKDTEGKTFYSWKDTAAKDLVEQGVDILKIKDHFRHKELKTTQKYMIMYGGVNESIRDIKKVIF